MSDTLKNGEWLKVGDSLWSPDGSVELKMQEDGKLAIYWEGECRFQTTDEERGDIDGIRIQEDGNFVIYDNDGNAVWASDTAEPTGDSSVEVVVQDDGNVVLYKKTAIWCSETHK
ncbi:hypothetical protein NW754_002390 [Fusarium falciforme]|uniref:Bulb-type lectin domain-containing protein n=1 Tax=Fusarium falciforme TaxID=195108 RepID=A0A9W8UWP9_9HYPO|nr:hypothetical protein NW754_002390 [Fusarium falciforme]KAJ4180440.1 hypothetical protein NW755_011737 [Fusarium falciforme]KAJ4196269.1 hypothetical protein NW767_009387 [Fusarium falciforme]KAJ4240387.1 hypothetical protein NW757_012457 [Fusarium falciforme]